MNRENALLEASSNPLFLFENPEWAGDIEIIAENLKINTAAIEFTTDSYKLQHLDFIRRLIVEDVNFLNIVPNQAFTNGLYKDFVIDLIKGVSKNLDIWGRLRWNNLFFPPTQESLQILMEIQVIKKQVEDKFYENGWAFIIPDYIHTLEEIEKGLNNRYSKNKYELHKEEFLAKIEEQKLNNVFSLKL